MTREPDRESPDSGSTLPNVLLILVLVLLLVWGIGGLYLPEPVPDSSITGVAADTVDTERLRHALEEN